MRTTFEDQVLEIKNIISSERLCIERVKRLIALGYEVNEYPMGSGGTGQVKELKNEIRIQIGYGHGKYNYAYAVSIKK